MALQKSFTKWGVHVVTVNHMNESKRLRPRMLRGCFPQERKRMRLPTPLFLLAQNLSTKWTVANGVKRLKDGSSYDDVTWHNAQ